VIVGGLPFGFQPQPRRRLPAAAQPAGQAACAQAAKTDRHPFMLGRMPAGHRWPRSQGGIARGSSSSGANEVGGCGDPCLLACFPQQGVRAPAGCGIHRRGPWRGNEKHQVREEQSLPDRQTRARWHQRCVRDRHTNTAMSDQRRPSRSGKRRSRSSGRRARS